MEDLTVEGVRESLHWTLKIGISLGFGIWILGFRPRDLVIGISSEALQSLLVNSYQRAYNYLQCSTEKAIEKSSFQPTALGRKRMTDADQVYDELFEWATQNVCPRRRFGNERGNSRSFHPSGDFPAAGFSCRLGDCLAGIRGDPSALDGPSGRSATGASAGPISNADVPVGNAARFSLGASSTHFSFQSIGHLFTQQPHQGLAANCPVALIPTC
jgi:hypothetical protein